MFFRKKPISLIEGWTHFTDSDQFSTLIDQSQEKPVLLFKHSTRCPVSSFAMNRLRQNWSEISDQVHFYFLDLIAHRAISNQIATDFDVNHQSPQLLIIHQGIAIMDCSHDQVNVAAVLQTIQNIS